VHPSFFYGGITIFIALSPLRAVKISVGTRGCGMIVTVPHRKAFP